MAEKITKTEQKLETARKKLQYWKDQYTHEELLVGARGFGKTNLAAQFMSSLVETESQVARLEFKVKKIHENREKRKLKRKQDAVNKRLDREGQKLAVAVQEWLK